MGYWPRPDRISATNAICGVVMAGIELNLDSATPEQLAAAFEELDGSATAPEVKEPENPAPAAPAAGTQEKNEPAEAAGSTQSEAAGQGDEPDPAGVGTKDGKHIIPYTVLKSERERANRAEELVKEAQQRVAALEEQLKAGQGANNGESARTEPKAPNVNDLSPDDLEALKEDFPTVYKAVMASLATAAALEAKLKPVEQAVNDDAQERARTVTENVQDAIDSVPKLAHIQASDAKAFELAKTFDAALRQQDAWADKPLAERFAKVIEMVEATQGAIALPGAKPAPQIDAAALKAAAQATAAKAAKAGRTDVPTSLSEFAAGTPAAQDELEAATQMTHQQLAEKMSTMTPEQMDAYLLNL